MSELHTPYLVILVVYRGIIVEGNDYQEIDAATLEVNLIFNDETCIRSFSIDIINDTLFEDIENFTLELRFEPGMEPPSNVTLHPTATVVNIIDDDGAIIILWYSDTTSCNVIM